MGASFCFAGGPVDSSLRVEEEEAEIPRFDLLRLRYESDEARGFEGSGAELESARYSVGGFLSKPIAVGGDWRVVPFFEYRRTDLDFNELSAGMPFQDKDLHEISLNALLFHQSTGSPWAYGAWARARLSSDLDEIDGDDFLYDTGIGAGYRVNDRLMLGLGFVGLELGRDSLYLPGPMVMWRPNRDVRLMLMGPLVISTWEVNEDWTLALRGAPNGGTWNVDDEGESNNYDLSSYVVRLHTEHRVKDNLWLSLGVGYNLGGDFEVRDSSDERLFKDDLEGGLSFSAALRLRAW